MSGIKQKFDPSTHRTVGGFSWRWLDVLDQLAIAVATVEAEREVVVFIRGSDGKAINGEGDRRRDFDLIPITHKPVDLPTNLREEIKYAAWSNGSNCWFGYKNEPIKCKYGFSGEAGGISWPLSCFDIHKDPAGPENSLHIRTKDGWERCYE
jgi:hypothetical protein